MHAPGPHPALALPSNPHPHRLLHLPRQAVALRESMKMQPAAEASAEREAAEAKYAQAQEELRAERALIAQLQVCG